MNPTVTYYPSIFQISIGDVFRANIRGLQDPDLQGYTKHYYAESERITSQIGRGNFSTLVTPVTDTATANRKVRRADSLVLALNPSITDTVAQHSYLTSLTDRQKDTCEAYWYHPDHLGSSSWITYTDGSAVQHLHYLPWGEDFVDQRTTSFNSMFTFSAKEKDSETGLSYFGSRYYSSDLSIWLSVDPMSDKYPSLSPYVYCADNPVKLVDPEGEDIVPSNKFINSTYFIVFQKMTKNNVYKQLSSRFSNNDNKLNFHLDYNTNPFTSNAGRDGINKSILIRENGIIISGDIFSEYGRPNGIEFSEIAKVQVLLHEIIHANNKLDNIQTPNHDGFDREKVLLGLIEYNETNNLGYSNDDLEILSWCGLTKSNEFKEYINSQSRKNGNSEEKEIQAFNIRLNLLLINKAPEARQED